MDNLKDLIARVSDFPKKGILFYDLTPIYMDFVAFSELIILMRNLAQEYKFEFNKIVGIEARGFILASPLALEFDCGFVPVRKRGKLPRPTNQLLSYSEYGMELHEIHKDDISPGEKILIVDDILATGGTAFAAGELVKQCGGEVAGYLFAAKISGLQKEPLDIPEKVACLMEFP